MSHVETRVHDFLDHEGVRYERISHHVDHTALQTAWDTQTPPAEFAKTVFVQVDGDYAMAVLPASDRLSEELLRSSLAAGEVRIPVEDEIESLCNDCELGAAPPFGNLYSLPVYVSPKLTRDETITFNGGTHREAIRMSYDDFARLVSPRVVPLAAGDDGAEA